MKFLIAIGLAAAAFTANAQYYQPQPYYTPPPRHYQAPPQLYYVPPPPQYYRPAPRQEYYYDHRGHQHRHNYGYRDNDRDGVPNRYDSRPNNPYRR